ncbi:hypothetical protein NA57DRAFT_80183 [Rhizodiscina lignyota]|uniref:Membrane insertase YidC/Oxa/ALB C-terminal domain-containing protein n=1 Tax=Rhizodiscina lignyota TaxID=1504668 RepID=A0A9P4I8I2_9PEZI|nr:hypothetical protein NA57DRAFT_80183 [Rhizodiscina lignyota]
MIPSRGVRLSQKVFASSQLLKNASGGKSRAFSTRLAFDANASIRWRPCGPQLQGARPMIRPATINLVSARSISNQTQTLSQIEPPTTSQASEASKDALAPTQSTSLDQLDFHTTSSGIMNVEPHIGYLKELGLDFGWGPTAIMQWAYEHVHVLCGTPWWQTILITCTLYRFLVLAFPQVIQSDQMARMKAMADVTRPITQEMRDAAMKGDNYRLAIARNKEREIRESVGFKPWKQFAGPIVQGFLGYGTFHLMRSMASLPVPGMQDGGFLWIKDLTVSDPYFILPVALSATMFYLIKGGGESGAGDIQAMTTMKNVMMYGLPAVTFIFMTTMPGCLQLSFTATALLGMAQGKILMRDSVRNALGLYPLNKPAKPLVVEDKKRQIKRVRVNSQNMAKGVMGAYQPPNSAPMSTASAPKQGLLGGLKKSWSNLLREAQMATGSKVSKQETKEQKERRRRAEDYERRRKREIDEDAEYRRDMRR